MQRSEWLREFNALGYCLNTQAEHGAPQVKSTRSKIADSQRCCLVSANQQRTLEPAKSYAYVWRILWLCFQTLLHQTERFEYIAFWNTVTRLLTMTFTRFFEHLLLHHLHPDRLETAIQWLTFFLIAILSSPSSSSSLSCSSCWMNWTCTMTGCKADYLLLGDLPEAEPILRYFK